MKWVGKKLRISHIKDYHKGVYECIGTMDNPPHYSLFSSSIALLKTGKWITQNNWYFSMYVRAR